MNNEKIALKRIFRSAVQSNYNSCYFGTQAE